MHISAVRVALVRALRGRVPYVYTPVYEGGERSPGLFMVGETPARQLKPAIHWLAEHRQARRWYLIGNDYVWPHVSHRAARRYVKESGGEVVGVDYVPFGCEDHEIHLARIRKARPDVVLVSMVGTDCVTFNRAFAQRASRGICCACRLPARRTHCSASARATRRISTSPPAIWRCSIRRQTRRFSTAIMRPSGGEAPMPNTIGQSCYEGIRLYAELARRAGSLGVAELSRVSEGLSLYGRARPGRPCARAICCRTSISPRPTG